MRSKRCSSAVTRVPSSIRETSPSFDPQQAERVSFDDRLYRVEIDYGELGAFHDVIDASHVIDRLRHIGDGPVGSEEDLVEHMGPVHRGV